MSQVMLITLLTFGVIILVPRIFGLFRESFACLTMRALTGAGSGTTRIRRRDHCAALRDTLARHHVLCSAYNPVHFSSGSGHARVAHPRAEKCAGPAPMDAEE